VSQAESDSESVLNAALAKATGSVSSETEDASKSPKSRKLKKGKTSARTLPSSYGSRSERKKSRLTKEEEGRLTLAAQREITIQEAADDLAQRMGRLPSPEELAVEVLGPSGTIAELHQIRAKARKAMAAMVNANIGLVMKFAKLTDTSLVHEEDLVQEGFLGLMRAVEKFEPSRGLRFSTYAVGWIRGRQSNWLRNKEPLMSIPRDVRTLGDKVFRTRLALEFELGRDPTLQEVADEIGVDVSKVDWATQAVERSKVRSTDTPLGEGGSVSLSDIIGDEEPQGIGDIRADMLDIFKKLLTPMESACLQLRYGLVDGMFRKYSEVGEVLGLTARAARGICDWGAQKLRRLRTTPDVLPLMDYLDYY